MRLPIVHYTFLFKKKLTVIKVFIFLTLLFIIRENIKNLIANLVVIQYDRYTLQYSV